MYNEPQRIRWIITWIWSRIKNDMNFKSDTLDATNDSCNIGSWTTSK